MGVNCERKEVVRKEDRSDDMTSEKKRKDVDRQERAASHRNRRREICNGRKGSVDRLENSRRNPERERRSSDRKSRERERRSSGWKSRERDRRSCDRKSRERDLR